MLILIDVTVIVYRSNVFMAGNLHDLGRWNIVFVLTARMNTRKCKIYNELYIENILNDYSTRAPRVML